MFYSIYNQYNQMFFVVMELQNNLIKLHIILKNIHTNILICIFFI